MVTLKTLIVTAPPELREALDGLSKMALIDRCASLRPGPMSSPLAAAKHALRSLARRWQRLSEEIREHEQQLADPTSSAAPHPHRGVRHRPRHGRRAPRRRGRQRPTGLGPAAQRRSRPRQQRQVQSYARVPRRTPPSQRRLYRTVIVRMRRHQPTIDYVTRRTAEGKTKSEIIRCPKRCVARETWAARYLA